MIVNKSTSYARVLFAIGLGGVCYAQSAPGIVVTSAASFQQGLPAKGSLASAFCSGLQVQGAISAATIPLPFTLGGISVTVGGAPAPILSVADDGGYQQINFEVPQEAVAGSDGTWTVTASQNGTQLSAQVASSQSPGEFFMVRNLGAFQHAGDYSLVSEQNPAHPGETVIGYLTGLPGTQPVVPTGAVSPSAPLAAVPTFSSGTSQTDQFVILLNGTYATYILQWLGLTPGLVGVYQVGFEVPSTIRSSNITVQLERLSCVTAAGTGCGDAAIGVFNPKPGCIPVDSYGNTTNVCASVPVPMPVR